VAFDLEARAQGQERAESEASDPALPPREIAHEVSPTWCEPYQYLLLLLFHTSPVIALDSRFTVFALEKVYTIF